MKKGVLLVILMLFLAVAVFSQTAEDADNDGYNSTAYGGDDCNDTDSAINPAASESCNYIDDDCDGSIDEDIPLNTYYYDGDSDGFGTSASIISCETEPPMNYSAYGNDCNDTDPLINPAAEEINCNNIDENCDGVVSCVVSDETGQGSAPGDTEKGNPIVRGASSTVELPPKETPANSPAQEPSSAQPSDVQQPGSNQITGAVVGAGNSSSMFWKIVAILVWLTALLLLWVIVVGRIRRK